MLDSEVADDIRLEKLKSIASARNAHNELDISTIAHFLDYYKNIIEGLGQNSIYFKWFEGDPNAIANAEKSKNFIAQLAAISPFWYSHYTGAADNNGTHQPASREPGTIHRWSIY